MLKVSALNIVLPCLANACWQSLQSPAGKQGKYTMHKLVLIRHGESA
jgi:hypothetical protein